MDKTLPERKIIHIDMDCFYAAVETLDFPELKGKPIAIGGGERGVLSTANYEARKFGVKSAMPTKMALQKCPHLILRPHRFERYKELSSQVRQVFYKHTELVEPLSLDEAYLDVTKNKDYAGSATWLAKSIKKEIFYTTGLTASAGVAPNKFLAKVASDWEKPNGIFTISPRDMDRFVAELPVGKIFGVGKVMQEHLHRWNIQTCGDLQKWSLENLVKEFGNWGTDLYNYARGIDHREVKARSTRKSLGVENTFFNDKNLTESQEALEKIYEELVHRWNNTPEDKKLPIKTIFVKLKTHDFETKTIDRAFPHFADFNDYAKLLEDLWGRVNKDVRLLGLGIRFEEENSLRAKQESFPV